MSEINWQSAYETLERQYEHTLLAVASALDEVESRVNALSNPVIHEVRTDVGESGVEFIVIATGASLEYSFVVKSNGNVLLLTPFGSRNSVSFSPLSFAGEVECAVSVRSSTAPKSVVSSASKPIACHFGGRL